MHIKRKTCLIICIVCVVLILFGGLLFLLFSPKKNVNSNISVIEPYSYMTFTDKGILHERNKLLYFADVKSGKDVVLCDKPNCEHVPLSSSNPTPTCNAAGIGSIAAFYNDRLYFTVTEDAFTQGVYEADTNAANRKKIAELEDVTNCTAVQFEDGYMIYAYQNTLVPGTIGDQQEKPLVGVALVNLSTHEVTYLPQKKDYSAQIQNVHIYDGNVYYTYDYNDVKIDYFSLDMSLPETQEYLKDHSFAEIYCYDMEKKTETCIFSERRSSVLAFSENVCLIRDFSSTSTECLFCIDLSTGKKAKLVEENNISGSSYVDGQRWLYSTDTDNGWKMKYVDLQTNQAYDIGQEMNVSTPYSFRDAYILGDLVYIFYTDPQSSEYCYGYLDKTDFYDGKFEKLVPLMYPNRNN